MKKTGVVLIGTGMLIALASLAGTAAAEHDAACGDPDLSEPLTPQPFVSRHVLNVYASDCVGVSVTSAAANCPGIDEEIVEGVHILLLDDETNTQCETGVVVETP